MKQLQRLIGQVPRLVTLIVISGFLSTVQAQPLVLNTETAEARITASFRASRPDLDIESVKPSPIKGMYVVQVSNGPVLYATKDGKYFVLGDLYEIAEGGFINLAEKEREVDRAELMAQVKTEDMIIFSPEEQPAKASVMVFTDVDCFYCQKLHFEVPDLNRLGIEVRYLAYPRAGIGSDSFKKIASAWCAKDPQEAITKLKNREKIPMNVCSDNPVAEQFMLGQKAGVNGTPALITPEGRLMPGYMPALQLAAALGVEVAPELVQELQKKMAAKGGR